MTAAYAQPGKSHRARRVQRASWRVLAGLLLVAACLYVLVPRLGSFHDSWQVLKHAHLGWLAVALSAALATYLIAATTYVVLAKRPLHYGRTLVVQIAGAFVNRILPGGAGMLSVNFDYLRKQKHSVAEAGSVIAVNNLLSFAGNLILLGGALVLSPTRLTAVHLPSSSLYWLLGVVTVVLIATVLWSRRLRHELYRTLLGVQWNVVKYRAHPLRLMSALGLSMLLTLLYTSCLAACAHAVGVHISLTQALVVMTAGVTVGTLTPTPGGLLGAEAGLFASLVAYSVPQDSALAIVLAYRFFTFWLALLFGAIALVPAERRGYL